MKSEKGLGVVGFIICIVLIAGIATGLLLFYKQYMNNQKNKAIESDMLIIQGACKVLNADITAKKKEDNERVGSKLNEYEGDDIIINSFKSSDSIPKYLTLS